MINYFFALFVEDGVKRQLRDIILYYVGLDRNTKESRKS